jgi:heme oxygenase
MYLVMLTTSLRSLHTHLNALITSRLPLALPPHSSSPDTYLTGLLPFAQVYIAFERAWDQVCARHISPTHTFRGDELWVDVPLGASEDGHLPGSQDSTTTQLLGASQIAPPPELAVLALLRSLRPRGLPRANRVRRDIASLAGIPLEEVDTYLTDHASDATILFTQHIEAAVAGNPHVLLAYAFVMYMAVFSGGRWIRSMLASPGAAFWSAVDLPASPPGSPWLDASYAVSSVQEKLRTFTQAQQEVLETAGLSLWFWSGLSDGLDIKADFKKQLDAVEGLLTAEMRSDIIAEAREIFIRCEGLVGELDERVGRQGLVVMGIKSRDRKELETENDDVRRSTTKLLPHANGGWWKLPEWGTPDWAEAPGYAGWALIFSCVSWYAMYQAGAFGAT